MNLPLPAIISNRAMPAAAPFSHQLEQLSRRGDWSFLTTELGTILGHTWQSDLSPFQSSRFTFQGVDRRKFSRFAIMSSEFLWTAASYPQWRSLIASKTLLWMGAAAALCGLKAPVLCGEFGRGRRLSIAWIVCSEYPCLDLGA
ncbi:hypothetical protein CEXT_162881 [Caerostris extrusa]|uniref:Uncharacterized protein n=1 Tax=Caerostris extrusa TaxID=172846 RepID=A0AAV4SQ79_CAEEX|nr:hypothetical protein CEXT_162881 [Caerostris extrusa]